MHLVINATEIGRQRGGNETYLLGLLHGLQDRPGRPALTLLVTNDGATALRQSTLHDVPTINVGRYRRPAFYLWQQTRALRQARPDWYFSTYFLPPSTPCRAAMLVHDLSFRAHPAYYPPAIAWYMRLLTGLAVRRADQVIVVSEFTRSEVARFYPLAAPKTTVIYNGVGSEFQAGVQPQDAAILQTHGLAPGYILALGNIHPRKNLSRLLDAYLGLRQQPRATPPWCGWGPGDGTAPPWCAAPRTPA